MEGLLSSVDIFVRIAAHFDPGDAASLLRATNSTATLREQTLALWGLPLRSVPTWEGMVGITRGMIALQEYLEEETTVRDAVWLHAVAWLYEHVPMLRSSGNDNSNFDEFSADCGTLLGRLRKLVAYHSTGTAAKEHREYLRSQYFRRTLAAAIYQGLPLGAHRETVSDILAEAPLSLSIAESLSLCLSLSLSLRPFVLP